MMLLMVHLTRVNLICIKLHSFLAKIPPIDCIQKLEAPGSCATVVTNQNAHYSEVNSDGTKTLHPDEVFV